MINVLMFAFIVYILVDLPLEPDRITWFCLLALALSLCSQGLGYAIGASFNILVNATIYSISDTTSITVSSNLPYNTTNIFYKLSFSEWFGGGATHSRPSPSPRCIRHGLQNWHRTADESFNVNELSEIRPSGILRHAFQRQETNGVYGDILPLSTF